MMTPERIDAANQYAKGNMIGSLGIVFVPGEEGAFVATMPVTPQHHQPMGSLHGGATAALVESLGSMGSYLLIDPAKQGVVGIEVNVNHLRGVRSGTVTATGRLLHQGRTTHVWDVRVTNEAGQLVAVARLTNLITDKRP